MFLFEDEEQERKPAKKGLDKGPESPQVIINNHIPRGPGRPPKKPEEKPEEKTPEPVVIKKDDGKDDK